MATTNNGNTIYLTPSEDRRIRETFKARWKQCEEQTGQAREPRDAKTAMSQVTYANLMSDMEDMTSSSSESSAAKPDKMVTFAVGHPYPPCTTPLKDLEPMKIEELKMETHHRGKVLKVRRVAPVVQLAGHSWTMVQEIEEGSEDVERLEISLCKEYCGEDILESGKVFEILEPYFTLSDDNEATLRIDHPSDIVVWPDDSQKVVEEPGDVEKALKKANEFKEEGNVALKRRELLEAHTKYSQGLKLIATTNEDLKFDLYRNRAHINLLLNRLDEAKADGLTAVTNTKDERHRELDSKAYFRAGYAAYKLGDFAAAKRYFEGQQKLMPEDKEAAARVRKSELRIKEGESGKYNFKKMKANLLVARSQIDVDAGSFFGNTEVKYSPGRGRGLFATRNIQVGEVVMCEKPFCVVWGHEKDALTALTYDDRDDRIRVVPAGLCKAVVQKLVNNPSQVEKVLDLWGDYPGTGKKKIIGESGPVIDVFQIQDIIARNAFGLGPSQGKQNENNASTGVWVLAAYINHSCVPNVKKEYIGDLMIMRAIRPIKASDEIFHAYDESHDYDDRAAALMNTWGFECTCELCAAEKADGSELRKKRKQLETKAGQFIASERPVGAKRLLVLKARGLLKSIEETYDPARYKGLPKTALLDIQQWLTQADTR